MISLIIWGAGGHASVVADAALAQGLKLAAVVDDSPHRFEGRFGDMPVYAPNDPSIRSTNLHFVVAIGDNFARSECFSKAVRIGWQPTRVIHPSAVISPSADIGVGTVVLPRAVVNARAAIGRNCIINTGSIVEHDCRVEDHTHVAPGAVLGGGAEVGSLSLIGITAAVLPLRRVGSKSVVGAGAVVTSFVPSGVTAAGVPARMLKKLDEKGRT